LRIRPGCYWVGFVENQTRYSVTLDGKSCNLKEDDEVFFHRGNVGKVGLTVWSKQQRQQEGECDRVAVADEGDKGEDAGDEIGEEMVASA